VQHTRAMNVHVCTCGSGRCRLKQQRPMVVEGWGIGGART